MLKASEIWGIARRPSVKYSILTLLIAGFFSGIIFWGGFNTAMEATNTKLDVITNKIVVAETRVQTGASLFGLVWKNIPSLSIGGLGAWLAHHFWPGK